MLVDGDPNAERTLNQLNIELAILLKSLDVTCCGYPNCNLLLASSRSNLFFFNARVSFLFCRGGAR
jgi:hypothetical protein